MILPDHEIEKRCNPERYKHPLVSPFKLDNLQPASIDLTLDMIFLAPIQQDEIVLLSNVKGTTKYERWVTPNRFVIEPQTFVLGSTAETIAIPSGLVGRVEGKSSLGRLGLLVHSTAGYIDPGFQGKITLEFYSLYPDPIEVMPGQKVCQVSFVEMTSPAQHPYGSPRLNSKYQGQRETTASRYA